MFTSGTSGRPKAVVHAHRAPCLQLLRWAEMEQIEAGDRVFSTYPFCWSSGFVRALGACLAQGARLVTMAHFEPAGALALMAQEQIDSVITPGLGHLDYRLVEAPEFDPDGARVDPPRQQPPAGRRRSASPTTGSAPATGCPRAAR